MLALILCTVVGIAQPTEVPFDVSPYAKQESVIAALKSKNIDAQFSDNDDFSPPSVQAVNVRWRDVDFDALRVTLSAETMEAVSVTVTKRCNSSTSLETLSNITDVIAELYGEPEEKTDAFVQWSRKGTPAISIVLAEDETSVSAQFDFEGIINRLASTDPDWPYQIPIDATSDEIGRLITKTCGRITERDESTIGTVACQVFGIKSRRMYIRIDGRGYASKIEATFDPSSQTELSAVLEKRYGAPTGTTKTQLIWRWVGGSDALRLDSTADQVSLVIDLLALEKKQYMR